MKYKLLFDGGELVRDSKAAAEFSAKLLNRQGLDVLILPFVESQDE